MSPVGYAVTHCGRHLHMMYLPVATGFGQPAVGWELPALEAGFRTRSVSTLPLTNNGVLSVPWDLPVARRQR